MKYALLLLVSLVPANVLSYNNDAYAKVHELVRSLSHHNRYNRGSNGINSTLASSDANIVKVLFELLKQVLAVVGVAEAVKQTGSGSQLVQRFNTGASDQDCFDDRSTFSRPVVSLPPYYEYTTETNDSTARPWFSREEHTVALKRFFGVSSPSCRAIEKAIERIVEEAIVDDTYLHLPTVRSILQDKLYGCSGREKNRLIRTFFKSETGLLTKFAVSQFGQKISVPFAIYDSAHEDLFTKLHDIAYHLEYCDGTYLVEACRAVEYLKGALLDSDQAYRRSCHMLFDAYYRLVMGHGCTALVELADLTKTGCRSFKKELQRHVVHTVAQFCEATTDLQSLPAEDREMINGQAYGLINNVNNLVAELKTVDLVLTKRKKRRLDRMYHEDIQGYVDRALPPIVQLKLERRAQHEQDIQKQQEQTVDPPVRDPPIDALDEQESVHEHESLSESEITQIIHYIQERTSQYHAARQEALTAYTNGTAVAEPLSDAAHKLLVQHECSPELFSVDLDTPVQQALQHEFVSIINTTAALDILNHDELALVLVPTLTQLAEAGVGFTVDNKLNKAATIADCCWTALDCLVAAGEGAVEGGVNTACSLFTLVRHPVQSATNIAENLVHCGYQLGKVLHEVGDIAISSLVDPEQGQRKRALFCNKLQVLHEAIQHKIQTTPLRELIKDATAASTETWLTGKCLRATAPLLSKALEKAEKAAQYIEEAIEIDNNFLIGDGVVTVAATTAETVEVATAAQGTARLGQVLERGGQLYAMAEQLQRGPKKDVEDKVLPGEIEIKTPVTLNKRTGSALKKDALHSFNDIIDNYSRYAKEFELVGNDKIVRKLYQIEGSLNGEAGIFEWIVDPRIEKGVTHRVFIRGARISGTPNRW